MILADVHNQVYGYITVKLKTDWANKAVNIDDLREDWESTLDLDSAPRLVKFIS